MQTNVKIIIGAVVVAAVGFAAYAISGGGMFQGRIKLADYKSASQTSSSSTRPTSMATKSYVDSKGYCADKGTFVTKTPVVQNAPADFQCPNGKVPNLETIYNLCVEIKKKSCFSRDIQSTTQDYAMCDALIVGFAHSNNDGFPIWECPTEAQCKQYKLWTQEGTLSGHLKSGEIKTVMTCPIFYPQSWLSK